MRLAIALLLCLVVAPAGANAGPSVAASRAAEAFVCPMHCEGSKRYEAARACPVCGMALSLVDGGGYRVAVTPSGETITAGVPTTLTFAITDPKGQPVRNLDVVHEKLVHLLITSADLSWFAHEHPERGAHGDFQLVMTFPAPGQYTLFHDFTPPRVGMQVVSVALTVDGTPTPQLPLVVDADRPKTVDGFTARLAPSRPLVAGRNLSLVVSLRRNDAPVTELEPFLGAMGHLIIVSADHQRFVHSHPVEPRKAPPKRGPDISFQARFPSAGTYKAWAQFQHQGRVLTIPFTMQVADADGGARR